MKRYTDIHHHILYGVDDGAQSAEEMRAMLEKAAADGIGRMIATSHITPGIQKFDWEQYRRALEEAREYCRARELDLQLWEGAEIMYTPQTCDYLEDGRAPTLAGTDAVLVEFMPDVRYDRLCDAISRLGRRGYLPILAHVERYRCLAAHPSRARKLRREMDVCFQVNCSSILAGRDGMPRRFVKKMLDWDLVDAIATDAHGSAMRRVHMREAWRCLAKAFGASYANELTDGHLIFGADEE